MAKKKSSKKPANSGADSKYTPEFRDRSFGISHLQILDENSELNSELDPDLSPEDRVRLYKAMVMARMADERLLKLQRQGRMGTFPLCTGQEASSCAPVMAMEDKDWFVGAFRELGGRLLRGEPLLNYILAYGGYEEGNFFEGGERTLPLAVIVGSQTLHAAGIAYAMKLKGEKETAVVCFMGDGATSEGDFHEALNMAAVWQVPVVFICQNNQWAISVPRAKQTRSETIAQKAIAYGMPGVQVDGNDPLAMYEATRQALDRARSGKGPTFIEAVTYRLQMHTTADDPTKYQPEEQLKEWVKRDPLPRFRKYLELNKLWDNNSQASLEEEIKQQIEETVKTFESMKDFKIDTPFDNVFGTRHNRIEEQRAEFLAGLNQELPHE